MINNLIYFYGIDFLIPITDSQAGITKRFKPRFSIKSWFSGTFEKSKLTLSSGPIFRPDIPARENSDR